VHHQDVAAIGLADEEQGELEAAKRRFRAVGQVDEGRLGEPQRHPLAGDQLLQRRRHVMRRQRQPLRLDRAAGAGRPCVQRGLQVNVLEHRQRAGHHRIVLAAGPEKAGDQVRHRAVGIVGVLGRVNPVEEGAERRRELPCLRLSRDVRHKRQTNNALPRARMVFPGGPGETTRSFPMT